MPPRACALVAEAADTPPPLLVDVDVLDVGGEQAETAARPAPARATAAAEIRRIGRTFLWAARRSTTPRL
jgi:hypothetical protein